MTIVPTMKKLTIARHGDCVKKEESEDGYDNFILTPKGEVETKELAGKLRDVVGTENLKIFSSSALRGIQSCEILEKELNIGFSIHNSLNPAETCRDIEFVLGFLRDIGHNENVLLLTHLEYIHIPQYFHTIVSGGTLTLPKSHRKWEIPRGHAWFIDCEKRDVVYL